MLCNEIRNRGGIFFCRKCQEEGRLRKKRHDAGFGVEAEGCKVNDERTAKWKHVNVTSGPLST